MGIGISITTACLTVSAPGCGSGNAGVVGQTAQGQAQTKGLSEEDAILLGNGLATKIAQNAYVSREMVVQSVYGATYQSGGMLTGKVVKHGTLKQTRFGGYSYQPTPTDKLVLVLKDATHEFEVRAVQGNTQAQTPAAFLDSNHQMEYVHRIPETSEIVVKANRVGMGWATHLKGWYVEEGKRYELDLKAEGGSYFEQGGGSGQESKTDYKVKGEVTGERMKLTVDERHFFHLISLGEAVTHSIDENRNQLVTGGDQYRWVDTSVTKIFRTAGGRMMPVFDAAEKWKATGKVLKNGKPFGAYQLAVGGKSVDARRKYHGSIDIAVKTKKGSITVQSFRGS